MSFYVPYCLENPRTHDVRVLGCCSYLPAALLGSFFVLWHAGPSAFLKALPVNILFLIGICSAIFAAAWVGGLPRLFLLFAVPPLLVALQGRMMVLFVRNHYVRRGWHAFEI